VQRDAVAVLVGAGDLVAVPDDPVQPGEQDLAQRLPVHRGVGGGRIGVRVAHVHGEQLPQPVVDAADPRGAARAVGRGQVEAEEGIGQAVAQRGAAVGVDVDAVALPAHQRRGVAFVDRHAHPRAMQSVGQREPPDAAPGDQYVDRHPADGRVIT
jgi:hypothetical protein